MDMRNEKYKFDDCMERNVSTITIAHKDRVFRFDYDWFDGFLHKLGVKVIIVTNERLSPQEEFA
ncbi:hypothetical protein [Bacillus cereus]|uniref:hypothetical protein n=1 Tax=Bacillus cereus TaxID=1396 RepID=UPI0015CF58AC|nr:hypothetical protein [Bacillus cereus]